MSQVRSPIFAVSGPLAEWATGTGNVVDHVLMLTQRCIDAYEVNPLLVTEHANIERATAQGGYGRRQIYELVQNGADALIGHNKGRVHVLLTEDALYCANEGEPIEAQGVDAILSSHISMKRGSEIGRFGLGFKSVLGVTTRPEFYSRSGSFGFNANEAADYIRAVVPNADRLPTLRVAWPLDPIEAATGDPTLASLMQWATTVVKLPRDIRKTDWLTEDLVLFPAEFLLFSSHVAGLTLEDRTTSYVREIQVQAAGTSVRLLEGKEPRLWRVFSTRYTPSQEAKDDAGELADRESLPIMWAAPLKALGGRGSFWAFFPTEYLTTLSGILNAPWKTNEDRQNLLTGLFNAEMLDVAARLIVDSLTDLASSDIGDPGRIFDLMPARGREAPNWADEKLTEFVYRHAATSPCIPDVSGRLCYPGDIRLHPAGLPEDAFAAWLEYPGHPTDWCHHSVEPTIRRSRVERICSMANRQAASVSEWLEALVTDATPEASHAAILAAAAIVTIPSLASQVRDAHIIRTRAGEFVRPTPHLVFLPVPGESHRIPDTALVDERVVTDEEIVKALDLLGIEEVDASSELELIIGEWLPETLDSAGWDRFWRSIRRMDADQAVAILRRVTFLPDRVQVRTMAGEYRPLSATLLPGPIVPEDGSRDAHVALDVRHHATELPVIKRIGGVGTPICDYGPPPALYCTDFRQGAIDKLNESLSPGSSRPREHLLNFNHTTTAGPLAPLARLTDEGRALYTEALVLAAKDEPDWILSHESRSYPPVEMKPPALWAARKDGRLRTDAGLRMVAACVSPSLGEWSPILPVALCGVDVSEALWLPQSLEQLSPMQWRTALTSASRCDDVALLGRFYAAASRFVPVPAGIRCREGKGLILRPPADVIIVPPGTDHDILAAQAVPFLPVESVKDAALLVERWGCEPLERAVTREVRPVPSGPPVILADRFPRLVNFLGSSAFTIEMTPCSAIVAETLTPLGKSSDEIPFHRVDEMIWYVDTLSVPDLLENILRSSDVTLDAQEWLNLREHAASLEHNERLDTVRSAGTLPRQLLAAAGADAVRMRLPRALSMDISDERAAELALRVYGPDTLQIFRHDLAVNGLTPPQTWAGSHAARRFVKEIGFPSQYAGFPAARRDPFLAVDGPPDLQPLHDFQRTIAERIHTLLSRGKGRAVLSLPTGAGKTRVAVESVVTAVRDGLFSGIVLWIAQSDELCEQAVQTWQYVWRAVGPSAPLHINRLWASNEADPQEGRAQVVVATDAKLQHCMGDPAYDWLAQAKCVFIDEAHHSIGPSYTALLNWLGLGRSQAQDRCPLVGLTATPFRGTEEQTDRLAFRYGRTRLDEGTLGDDPYATLQDMGVLAYVDHKVLPGADVTLNESQRAQLRTFPNMLPTTAEQALGTNRKRNDALISSIMTLPPDWPVLLFATSVEHAQTMAALLAADGVPAAAVSAETAPPLRRWYIEEFRNGNIRVLTNYAVLTTGFDAPAVRAVYVARPTFSPILYQQMIGRGLRGVKNGGKERCLIVNVRDNILQYGEQLAFTQFEHLWAPR